MNSVDWVNTTISGGLVKRFHTCLLIGHETVAEHSFGVAMIVIELCDGKPSIDLLKAALYHDIAEQRTGDIPFPTKQRFPILKSSADIAEEAFNEEWSLSTQLSTKEASTLKWADMLQLLFFCKQQRDLGNKGMNAVFARGVEFLSTLPKHQKGQEILTWLVENYAA